jgi:hypothetical protein
LARSVKAHEVNCTPWSEWMIPPDWGSRLAMAIYGWRRQELIDTGKLPGLNRAELAELSAANRRICELETEVAILKGARELLKEPHDPKDGTRP